MSKHKNKSLLFLFALIIGLSVVSSVFFFNKKTEAAGNFTLTVKLTGNGIKSGTDTTVTATPNDNVFKLAATGISKNFKLSYSNGAYTGSIINFYGSGGGNDTCGGNAESPNNMYVISAAGTYVGSVTIDLNCTNPNHKTNSTTHNLAVQTSAGAGIQTQLTGNLVGKLVYTVNGKNIPVPDGTSVNLFDSQTAYNNATSLTDTSGGSLFNTKTNKGDGSFSFSNIDLGRPGSRTFFFESYYSEANTGTGYLTGGDITLTGGVQALPANLSVLSTQTNCALNGTNNTACSGGSNTPPTCESSGGPLSWAFCALITEITAGEKVLENIVSGLLTPPPLTFDSGDKIFQAWSSFRNYGNIILVVALLAAIIAESIGGGLSEAYTVKKMLPRILIAVILINLSIYIVAGLIDITNVVAKGINNLISVPFLSAGQWHQDIGGVSGSIGILALLTGAGAIWVAGTAAIPVILLFVILPLFFAVVGVLITLTLRIAILTLLIMIAPVAFALYALPNTEQYFKKWWDLLFKTLLVFPIVMIVFAMCNVLPVILSQMTSGQEWWNQLMASAIRIVPLFLIPFAFKIAGGLTGSIYGAVANTNKKITEGIKGNPNDRNSLRNKAKRGLGESVAFKQQKAIGSRDYKGRRFRSALSKSADLFGNNDARVAGYNKEAAERRETLTGFGDDGLVYAGAGYTLTAGQTNHDGSTVGGDYGSQHYFDSKGREIDKQKYTKGKSLYGNSQHSITQGLSYTTQKILTNNDKSAMKFAFDRNAEEGNWSNEQLKGNWEGATYPHKAQQGTLNYEKPYLDHGKVMHKDLNTDEGAYGDLMKYRNIGNPAFRLSEVRDEDWAQHSKKQKSYEAILESGGTLTDVQAQNLAMTYELFDAATHEMQAQPGQTTGPGGASDIQVTASGVSAAAGPIVEKAKQQRKYQLEEVNSDTHEKALFRSIAPPAAGAAGPIAAPAVVHGGIFTSGDNLK
jgi:hypothetical protein